MTESSLNKVEECRNTYVKIETEPNNSSNTNVNKPKKGRERKVNFS